MGQPSSRIAPDNQATDSTSDSPASSESSPSPSQTPAPRADEPALHLAERRDVYRRHEPLAQIFEWIFATGQNLKMNSPAFQLLPLLWAGRGVGDTVELNACRAEEEGLISRSSLYKGRETLRELGLISFAPSAHGGKGVCTYVLFVPPAPPVPFVLPTDNRGNVSAHHMRAHPVTPRRLTEDESVRAHYMESPIVRAHHMESAQLNANFSICARAPGDTSGDTLLSLFTTTAAAAASGAVNPPNTGPEDPNAPKLAALQALGFDLVAAAQIAANPNCTLGQIEVARARARTARNKGKIVGLGYVRRAIEERWPAEATAEELRREAQPDHQALENAQKLQEQKTIAAREAAIKAALDALSDEQIEALKSRAMEALPPENREHMGRRPARSIAWQFHIFQAMQAQKQQSSSTTFQGDR